MPGSHTIFYAEDDLDDLFIVKQAFRTQDAGIEIVHANNGFEAMETLQTLHEKNEPPSLILLDINMPGMDGRETLVRIKQHEQLKKIPAVMFSTSSSSLDREFASKWDAQFFTKPLVYAEMEKMVNTFIAICNSNG